MAPETIEENAALLEALAAFQQAPGEESEQALMEAISAAQFLLVTKTAASDENTRRNYALRQLPVLSNGGGESFLFGFSDETLLAQWGQGKLEEAQRIYLSFSEVIELVLGQSFTGFIINPGTGQQYIFPARVLAAYSGRGLSVTLPENTQVVLGAPRQFPEELGEAVRRAVRPLREVRRLWLLLKMERQSGEKSILILIERIGGDYHKICQVIGHAASGYLPSSMSVEMLESNSALACTALQKKDLSPFFDRGQQKME